MKLFRRLLCVVLALIIAGSVFSVSIFAADAEDPIDLEDGTYVPNQVVVLFKDSAINTDTAPKKDDLAAVGADFGDMMDASSSSDEAYAAAD